jgi:2,3-dihydro-2,3-dihydroxybenzoate dehydrogenase
MITQWDFRGKVIWVTGAYQGMGAEITRAFAEAGATVVALDKRFAGDEWDGHVRRVHLDLADAEQIRLVTGKLLAEANGIDALVSAAGVFRGGGVEALAEASWQEMFDVNVTGVYHLLKAVVPVFKRQKSGSIVAIGSNAAHVPRTQMAGYGASKAALHALCRAVGLELAPYGARVNVVAPGSTDTPMQRALWSSPEGAAAVVAGSPADYRLGIPLGKIGTVQDVAGLVLFLVSDLAGHIVLQDIVIDGGATLGA